MINDKLKVFVRFNQGACGNFITLMALSLTKPVTLNAPNHGHMNVDDIDHNHNFNLQFNPAFRRFTSFSPTPTIEKRIRYIQSNFEFYPTENSIYVIRTHAIDPTPLIDAFDNTRLITITNTQQDISQLAYNWIIKCVIKDPTQIKLIERHLVYIQKTHNRLLNIPLGLLNVHTDIRLLTYINCHARYNNIFFTDDYKNIHPSKNFTIKFEDIMNKNVIAQLDDLISFLGITVSEERKQATIQMIHSYVDNQTIIPFDLPLDAFD